MNMLKGREVALCMELKTCVRENDANLENIKVYFNATKCRKSLKWKDKRNGEHPLYNIIKHVISNPW